MSIWIHWNIQWLPGPEIEPGTPATLVRSSTAVLPSPISTVHIAPTSTLNSLRPRKLPQIFLLTEVNLSFPGAGHGTICRMRNEQVHTMKTYDWTWNRTRDQYNSSQKLYNWATQADIKCQYSPTYMDFLIYKLKMASLHVSFKTTPTPIPRGLTEPPSPRAFKQNYWFFSLHMFHLFSITPSTGIYQNSL